MKIWRRLRAAVGMGLAWGLAWLGAGLVLLVIVGPGAADVPFPVGFGALGFLAGALFSLVLSVGEAGRRFEDMSVRRFAGWGAVGGVLFSVLFVAVTSLVGAASLVDDLVYLGPLFAAAGATSAGGALAIARAGEDPEALEGGESRRHLED